MTLIVHRHNLFTGVIRRKKKESGETKEEEDDCSQSGRIGLRRHCHLGLTVRLARDSELYRPPEQELLQGSLCVPSSD